MNQRQRVAEFYLRLNDRLLKQAQHDKRAPSESQVVAFLKKNPEPTDSVVHDWAKENGWDVDHTERIFFRLAGEEAKTASALFAGFEKAMR